MLRPPVGPPPGHPEGDPGQVELGVRDGRQVRQQTLGTGGIAASIQEAKRSVDTGVRMIGPVGIGEVQMTTFFY